MPTTRMERMETLETVERNGTIQRVTRAAVVVGIIDSDWKALLTALNEVDVPNYGARLDIEEGTVGYPLIVNERTVSMIDEGTARVVLVYENAFMVDNMEDNFDDPFMSSMGGEVRCNIQQKSSNLDEDGVQVVVSHTYPADDPNYPGMTVEQGGEFQYFEAQRSFAIHGIKATETPWLIANAVVARVNSVIFSGEPVRTWLCIGANWKPEGIHNTERRFFMNFEFQFDADTWDPDVVFIDAVTGKPPPNLVPGTGIKTIQKLGGAAFETVIGTLIQGG